MDDSLRRKFIRDSIEEARIFREPIERFDMLVAEVEYALYPPKHEGKLPTYGCRLTTYENSPDHRYLAVDELSTDAARCLADGIHTYLIIDEDGSRQIEIRKNASDEEFYLIYFARESDDVLIHRSRSGVIRMFTQDGVFIHEAAEWKHRPYGRSVVQKVRRSVPQAGWTELDKLLNFAFHTLSPTNTGATLVWWLTEPPSPSSSVIDLSGTGFNAMDFDHMPALRAILRRHDGATYLSPKGDVQSIGHHLPSSDRAIELIKQTGGTRHTSAARFSFDEPRAVVIVVSEDGPVSVFSDGFKVSELAESTIKSTKNSLIAFVPEKADDIYQETAKATCRKCGKTCFIQIVTVIGFKERESVSCPVCGHKVHSALCWDLEAWLVKDIPEAPFDESKF